MQAAQGIVGLAGQTRSNIRNAVDYDPIFAQALNITRGLLPGNDVKGIIRGGKNFEDDQYIYKDIQNLTRPPSLIPQIEGEIDGKKAMFFSRGEQGLQQYLPGIVKQGMDMGIMGLAKKGFDIFSKLFGGDQISPQQIKRTDTHLTIIHIS